jgi:glutamine amidotransferase PdxT
LTIFGWIKSSSEFQQIINDPNLLNEKIDECLNKLIELVRGELTRKQEVQYLTAAEQFKEEITSGKPDSTKMQRLLRTLAFLGDIEGTIALAARVWASLAPLVMIAAQLIHQ